MMWSVRNGTPNSSLICLLPVYQNASVRMQRNLQFTDMGASDGPPHKARVVYHRAGELLIRQHSIYDGEINPV
jgi:hypothetical protein